jgi:anti-anti-sigma regulatory factor
MSGSTAHLVGDWSVSGVTQHNLETLSAALQRIEPTGARRLQIDCRRVHALDATGQQILKVWVQCVKLRGAEPELVIPTNNLQQSFRNLGVRCRFASLSRQRQSHSALNQRKRRSRHENRRGQENCHAAWH